MAVKNVKSEFAKANLKLESFSKKELTTRANKLYKNVVEATPIDTGFARKSWNKEIVIKSGKEYETNLYNTAPYIEQLNNGSSAQAPKRFIEKEALKLFRADGVIVKRIIRK